MEKQKTCFVNGKLLGYFEEQNDISISSHKQYLSQNSVARPNHDSPGTRYYCFNSFILQTAREYFTYK